MLEANINVTPLVDVCLVLLIIFMVVTPAIVNGVPVALPKSATVAAMQQTLPITVKADGMLFVGSNVVRREQLAGELARVHAKTPSRPVVVRGDKRVRYGDVLDVLSVCRAAGLNDVGLMAEKTP